VCVYVCVYVYVLCVCVCACVCVSVCDICVQAVLLMSCGIAMVVIALLNMNLADGLLEDMCQSGAEDAVCVCVCVCV